MNAPEVSHTQPESMPDAEPFSIDGKAVRTMTDDELQNYIRQIVMAINDGVKQHLELLNQIGEWTAVRGALDYEIHRRKQTLLILPAH